MAQKFILTQHGVMRLGNVRMHKDLLEFGDFCYGGGFYEVDYGANRIILSGASFDFGFPLWERLLSMDISLKIPEDYRGMGIIYRYDDQAREELKITEEFQVEYV